MAANSNSQFPEDSNVVSNIEFTWYSVVVGVNPYFEREKHHDLQYDFGDLGHRARNFYADPYTSGAYEPRPRGDFSPSNFNNDFSIGQGPSAFPVVPPIIVVGN